MSRGRLPPGGKGYDLATLRRLVTREVTSETLAHRLALRLGVERVDLTRSGREGLRLGMLAAAKATGRDEIVVPGYACFSVPAAAVAAGLRVRLVEVDAMGRIDPEALSKLPLERAAALVVCNLFGRAEPLGELAPMLEAAGAWLMDDAAQAFGATPPAEPGHAAGARGDLGVLSFGRGKPLCGLGGGALVVRRDEVETALACDTVKAGRASALARALAYDVALAPIVFATLASIPALGIGETPFDPGFARGGIEPASLALTDVALDAAAGDAEARVREAQRLAVDLVERTRLRPILPEPGERSVLPRLVVRAPDEATRASALAVLSRVGAGATSFYPSALSRLDALKRHRVCTGGLPEAERLAGRVLTLPVHGGLRGARWGEALRQLAGL